MKYQKITKVSKNSQWNNSEKVTNENDKEIYVFPKERKKIIDNLWSIIKVQWNLKK